MSILTYSVRTTRPRIFVTQAEKSLITNRTLQGWQSYWVGDLATYLAGALGETDESLVDDTNSYSKCMCFGLYGWIQNSSAHHTKLLSMAKFLAQTERLWWDFATRRWTILALSYAYDYLRTGVITFSEADRKIIGDALVAMCNRSASEAEFLDGHSGGNVMAQMIAGMALAGESGSGYDYTTSATTLINKGLNFWYGDTPGDHSGLEPWRYFGNAGAHWLGGLYSQLGMWKIAFVLNSIRTAFLQNAESPGALQLNGEDYDPVTSETWLNSIGEFCLHVWMRGDYDFWRIHDCQRDSYPWVSQYMRHGLSFLVSYGGQFRKQLHWLISTLNGIENSQGLWWAPNLIHDVLFYDPRDTLNTAIHPKNADPAIAKTRFFMPPGSYWYKSSWDYPNACTINIECPERFILGHQHLSCGGIQIGIKNDQVLLFTGKYDNTDADAEYGGRHHHYYTQQSISHSGVPLIDDGTTTHSNYSADYGYMAYPSGLGGQLWKTYTTGGTTYKDPSNLTDLRFSGGGEAWLRCEPELVSSSDSMDFLFVDLRRAYAKDYQDMDTSAERVRLCQVKYLVIKGESVWPIVLRVVHIQSRLASFVKRDHFHGNQPWSLSYPHKDASGNGITARYTQIGRKGQGKVTVDLYRFNDYALRSVGGGTNDPNGYEAYQFYYGGVNYPPAKRAEYRYEQDLGHYRVEFEATIQRTEEYFVELIQPMLIGEQATPYTWIDEANWFGVRFSSSSHEYRIHKTLPQAIGTSDTTPPGVPTGLTAVPGHQKVALSWSPNTEQDIYRYKLYYRQKV